MLSMPRIVRPDRSRFCANEIGSPIDPATRRAIKRNKELEKRSYVQRESQMRQLITL